MWAGPTQAKVQCGHSGPVPLGLLNVSQDELTIVRAAPITTALVHGNWHVRLCRRTVPTGTMPALIRCTPRRQIRAIVVGFSVP